MPPGLAPPFMAPGYGPPPPVAAAPAGGEAVEEIEPLNDEEATRGYRPPPVAMADAQAFQATAYAESGPYGPPPGAPGPGGPLAPPVHDAAPSEPALSPAPPEQAVPRKVIGAVLLSYQDDSYGRHWLLHDGDNLVGRADTAVMVDVPISHGTTSTRHATIHCTEGQVTLTDLKSTNGTFQNGRKLLPNSPAQVASGDKLRFGGFTVHVYFPPSRQQ